MSVCSPRKKGTIPGCGVAILWCWTDTGGRMPINVEPSRTGRWRKERVEGERKIIHYVTDAELAANTRPLYEVHWATCPYADQHRSRR